MKDVDSNRVAVDSLAAQHEVCNEAEPWQSLAARVARCEARGALDLVVKKKKKSGRKQVDTLRTLSHLRAQ